MGVCQFDARKPKMIANLLTLYRTHALPADIQQGSYWYPAAQHIVREWAKTYTVSTSTVACVIAALSPQLEWAHNLIIADDVLAGRNPSIGGVIQSNLAKARHILADQADSTFPYFSQGPKVASFAENLKGNMDFVTVDTHALQAALGDARATYSLPWRPYTVFAECYARAAQTVDLSPAMFQAIIWCVWKRLYPRTKKILLRKQWEAIGDY